MRRALLGGAAALAAIGGMWTAAGWSLWVHDAPASPEHRRVRDADRVIYLRARADQPARFELKGGERFIKVVTHGMEGPAVAADGRLRYALDFDLRDPRGASLYTVRLHTASRRSRSEREGAPPNAFLLDDPRPLFDDRVIRLELPVEVPPEAVLEVRAADPRIDVLVRTYAREALDAVHRRAVDWWDDPAQQRTWRWSRRPGLGEARAVYYTGRREPFEERQGTERMRVDVGRAVALQAQGPVTLGVRVVRPPGSSARQLSVSAFGGAEGRSFPVPQAAHGIHQALLTLPAGIHSLHWTADGPVDLQVDAPSGEAARFGDVPVVPWRARELLLPDERRLRVFEARPDLPLRYAVEPGQDELRLQVRAVDPPGERQLTVELIDAEGEIVERFAHGLAAPLAPFERIDRSDGRRAAVGEPVTLFVPLEEGIATVRIAVDRPTVIRGEVRLAAPPEAPRLAEPYAQLATPDLQWRYAPLLAHDWHSILPLDRAQLAAAGADPLLVAQVRLEPTEGGNAPARPARFRAVQPRGRPLSQIIAERPTPEARGALRARWPRGAMSEVAVDAPWTTAGPTVLRWWLPRSAEGGVLAIHEAGGVRRLPLRSSGGIVRLDASDAPRRVVVEGSAIRPRIFVSRPVAGAPVVVQRRVHPLGEGGLTVGVRHRAGTRQVLNLVVHAPGMDADPQVRLEVRIDGGEPRRTAGLTARRPTPGIRHLTLPAARSGDRPVLLDVDGQAVGHPRTIPIQLGPDLVDGAHTVEVRVVEGRRLWARFFEAGAPVQQASDWHWRRREGQ